MLIVILALFFGRTIYGKALRATAMNRTGARLMGISTVMAGKLSFLLAALIGAFSGILIAPITTIYYDTGFLIGLKGFVGAIVGGASEEAERSLAAYGMHLGTAFQIIDDVLDYSGAEVETGKHLGDDLAEGKPTLPLIYVMQHGNAEQAACVRHAIENGGRDDFAAVLAAIRATGALDHAKKCAEAEVALATQAIECLPASTYKDSLLELCLFAVARSF